MTDSRADLDKFWVPNYEATGMTKLRQLRLKQLGLYYEYFAAKLPYLRFKKQDEMHGAAMERMESIRFEMERRSRRNATIWGFVAAVLTGLLGCSDVTLISLLPG
jgi:hypothetical protein